MKYYERTLTQRKAVNRFGRLGFVLVRETVKTNDITPFNKGKRIRFVETNDRDIVRQLRKQEKDTVYQEDLETLSRTW